MEKEGISEERFFEIWKKVCKDKESELVKAWKSTGKEYTDVVLGRNNSESVICKIKSKLCNGEYDLQQEYYSCDVVYYKDNDCVTENPINKTNSKTIRKTPGDVNGVWLKKIRIHLEHENDIKNSWQEITQLCVMPGRELNVLVTYPNNEGDSKNIINAYKSILSGNDSCKSDSFHLLVIFGFLEGTSGKKSIEWKGWKWDGTELNEITGQQ